MNKVIQTEQAPAAIGPYSQAIQAGNFLYTSGQLPVDPATGELAGESITAQAEQSIKNVGAVLAEAGYQFTDAVKTLCFLSEIGRASCRERV